MDIRRTILIGMTLVLTALMTACATAAQDQPPARGTALLGTEWVLVSLNGNAPIEGKPITLSFGEESLDGSGGCNTYFGAYAVSGSEITIRDVASTEMWCSDPEDVMDQEQAFLAALASAASYRLAGTRLELLDATGSVILAFEPAP